jgi:hypothetical protein
MAYLADLSSMAAPSAPRFRRTQIGRAPANPTYKKKKATKAPTKRPTSGSFLANLPTLLTDEQARDRAMALLAPIFEAQNSRVNRGYDARAAAIKDAYAQLAQFGQGVGPAVQGAYEGAAKDTAAFGKGFSDAISQLSGGQASAATAALPANSPQTVTSGLQGGGGDALYAMGGQIPASQLSREGAAFTSAASFLPSTAAGLVVEATRDSEAERLEELRGLEGDRTGTVLDMIRDLTDTSYNRRQDATKLALDERDYQDKRRTVAQEKAEEKRARRWEAAVLKQAYGYKLSPWEKKLIATFGASPEAVKVAGDASLEAADDARSAAAARAKDQRAASRQARKDQAQAAREAAKDARRVMLEARKAAARSGLERDKQTYRMALEKYKAAQRRALQKQKDTAALNRKGVKPGTKKSGGTSADTILGGGK